MDRQIEQPNEILTDIELLTIQRNSLIGLGWLSQSVLGTSAVAIGLPCAPTSPASMSVQIGVGAIYSQQSLDATAYGSLAADTGANHQIVKQGLNLATQSYPFTAPTTSGQSVVYLIQAEYQDFDTNSVVLQYFNPANPSVAFTGQSNGGAAQNTTRQGLCAIAVKTGVAATTGSQTAPAADSGYSPLYTITIAYGATTITSANIAVASGAPFLPLTLPAVGSAVAALQANTQSSLVNLQTVSNNTLTSVSGSGANVYTTALSGSITKATAASNLIFWLSSPTYASGTGPTIVKFTVGSQSITNLCVNSSAGSNASSSQINGILSGLPAGTLSWSVAFARGDGTAWSCSVNPNSTINSALPPSSLTSLVFGET